MVFGWIFWYIFGFVFGFLFCFVNFGCDVLGCCCDFVCCLVLFFCVEVFVGFVFKWVKVVGYFGFVNLLLGLGINVVPSSRMLDKCSELRFEKDYTRYA